MILTVTLNPAVDHQLFLDELSPNDTNRIQKVEVDAGGKGINLSRVYAELGGETVATGLVGGSGGIFIERVLADQGVHCDFVSINGFTRLNISVEDLTGRPPTTFNERGPVILAEEYDELLAKVSKLAARADWICLGGSLPPGVPIDTYRVLGSIAKESGCKLMLDADKDPCIEGLKAYPDFVKPNQKEAGRLLGRSISLAHEAVGAARELREKLANGCEAPIVVISRGAEGAVLACEEGTFSGSSAPVEPKSTVGSGDSFLAGMLWAMTEGAEMAEALRWGLAAGAATATTDGTEIGRRSVIQLLYGYTTVDRIE